jgi:hypothetical protein
MYFVPTVKEVKRLFRKPKLEEEYYFVNCDSVEELNDIINESIDNEILGIEEVKEVDNLVVLDRDADTIFRITSITRNEKEKEVEHFHYTYVFTSDVNSIISNLNKLNVPGRIDSIVAYHTNLIYLD